MIFRIHSGSGVPIYLQIEAQVKQAVAAGALERDEAMPSIRQLAAELRVNPNTVARAYSNLEREGTIRTVPGGGTFVAARTTGLVKSEKLRRVRIGFLELDVPPGEFRSLAPKEIERFRKILKLDGEHS